MHHQRPSSPSNTLIDNVAVVDDLVDVRLGHLGSLLPQTFRRHASIRGSSLVTNKTPSQQICRIANQAYNKIVAQAGHRMVQWDILASQDKKKDACDDRAMKGASGSFLTTPPIDPKCSTDNVSS
jgi:hypothetical protein